MKLAAIYNIWDGVELLEASLRSIINHVDRVIIVYQTRSNFGEDYNPYFEIVKTCLQFPSEKITLSLYEPVIGTGAYNEKAKRNRGIEIARSHTCTHFLHMDTDECYENFGMAKQQYIDSGAEGSVCKIFTYFKKPTWRFETEDGYYVPFIHKLNPNTFAGIKSYPFYVDPTRRINESNIVLLDIHMHHFSWVRYDIERKARNSSAKDNLEKGTMLKDFYNPAIGPGFYVKDYDKKLIEVNNDFNI